MKRIVQGVKRINAMLFAFSLALLAGLMFLTVGDVTGRFFGHPVRGAYQISEILQVAVICLAWPITTYEMAHVKLDLVLKRLSPGVQNKIELFTHAISLLVFAVITWQGVVLTRRAFELGDLVAIIDIPLFPFLVVIPVGAFVNCIVLLIRMGNLIGEARGRGVS